MMIISNEEVFMIKNFLLHNAPFKLFLAIHRNPNTSGTKLAKITNITWNHTSILLRHFKDLGLITEKKVGREKNYKLTAVGKKVEKHLSYISDSLRMGGSFVGLWQSVTRNKWEIVY
jgi:predicted transcriptional regulator